MHKPTTSKVRKRILILAAAALILSPSLNLPAAKAQTTAPSNSSGASAAPSSGETVSPQVAPTGETAVPASGETPAAATPSASTPSAASDVEPAAVDPAVTPAQPALVPSTRPVTRPTTPSTGTPSTTPPTGTPSTTTPTTPPTGTPSTVKPTTPSTGTPSTVKPTTPAVPAVPDPFYDILKDPNREAILALYEAEIVKPAKDRKFRPQAEIGRADFSVILGRAMNANGSIFDVYFTDPIPDWAIRYVGGLTAAGLYEGYLDGDVFGPKQPVTRAEAAAMVARAAHLESQPLPEGLGGVGNIPVWALDDVGAAYAAGLIVPTETGTLNPNKKVTRSEMAAMVAPLLEADAFTAPVEVEENDDTRPPTMPPL
ncbi:S-layer homology domain-containing protein [Saccharibacillus sp. WB 17]|uniref:S-layer homology domain-containing protein n=1 Tax=Saccharibacillus sp. WB 17 TaxID=2603535 RepID=UPI00123C1C2B|nr:S-layer homology domain-containing protein [Saccharibacillus sp. WB 17]MWJ32656.1 hypothetical protein [Saccharibacillus sp. WB 17]